MARVYLVRHAKAEKAEGPGGDAARTLTRKGREKFEALARALALPLRRIATSPLVRARETADLLAAATGAPIEEDEALAAGASTGKELLALARKAGDGTALVGHNPEIAEAIALAAGREEHVPAGSVAALDVDGTRVKLAWLREP
jgi:phosphohistidine phosphatase